MIIVVLGAVGATLVAAILVALVYLTARKQQPGPAVVARWAARLWIFAFVVNLILLYIAMPALTGPYWGWQWVLWPLLLTGAFALFGGGLREMRSALDSFTEQINGEAPIRPIRGRYRTPGRGWTVDHQVGAAAGTGTPRTGFLAGAGAIVVALLIATLVNGLIVAFTTWGDGNAKVLAAIPTLQEQPATSQLPPTDVNHIVLVTQGVAAYLGQQVLASGGRNLGSQYHTEQSEYTLQSVNHHLYWIAPLVYNNVWANVGNWQSPGYVVVDAENPNSGATLKTGYHMRYLPDALLNQDLLRHVYLSGYTEGDLADPTLEVDDSWNPYFTISLMQPTRGFTGAVVRRVLLVDAQSGAIQSLAVDKVPSWVDRIMPSDTVNQYLTWWGLYHSAPWFNPSGANQQVPPASAPELVYNTVDQPVWLVTMTSNSNKDQSSTGVVLFDTRDSTGKFYPLSGIGIGDNVTQTFAGNPSNLQHYDVGSVQLYQIYGEPTWVATFVKSNDSGQNFAAVGMVDARHLTNANVIMAPDKAQALSAYAQYLASANISTGVSPSGKQVTIDGKVVRISSATQNGSTIYYFTLEGQSKIFEAGLGLSPKLPLVQPGDQVHITYLDTGESTVTLTSFDDYSIQT